VQLAAADIEETPDFGAQIDTDFLLGMAKVKGVVKALLDIDRVISGGAFAGDPALSGALA
jgi:purine-binding chemotaxis protein CheW